MEKKVIVKVEDVSIKFSLASEKFDGFKEYFIDGTPDDYDIKTPFDHIEYDTLNPGGSEFTSLKYLSHDEDGYDFIEGDFS